MSRPILMADNSISIPIESGKYSGSVYVMLRRPTMMQTVDIILRHIYIGMGRPDEMRVSVERPYDDEEHELYRGEMTVFSGKVDVYGITVEFDADRKGIYISPVAGVNIEFAD